MGACRRTHASTFPSSDRAAQTKVHPWTNSMVDGLAAYYSCGNRIGLTAIRSLRRTIWFTWDQKHRFEHFTVLSELADVDWGYRFGRLYRHECPFSTAGYNFRSHEYAIDATEIYSWRALWSCSYITFWIRQLRAVL